MTQNLKTMSEKLDAMFTYVTCDCCCMWAWFVDNVDNTQGGRPALRAALDACHNMDGIRNLVHKYI